MECSRVTSDHQVLNGDPVHKDNPDGAVRAHAFGRGGLMTYLILEDQRRVDVLTRTHVHRSRCGRSNDDCRR